MRVTCMAARQPGADDPMPYGIERRAGPLQLQRVGVTPWLAGPTPMAMTNSGAADDTPRVAGLSPGVGRVP